MRYRMHGAVFSIVLVLASIVAIAVNGLNYALDFTGYRDFSGNHRGTDFGLRGIEGFWIDLHRAYGVYIYVAESFEMLRWLSFTFEAGIGFQGRYP